VVKSAGPTPEWPATLDVAALLAEGWQPVPFREFIVKIHSRCDLACDYCYMYQMADQSWRDRPRRMAPEIAACTAARIGEHAQAHGLTDVNLVLHGGEPLLAGPDLITDLVTAVRDECGPDVTVGACIQTNGVRLDGAYLDLFEKLGVRVGVSLDGTADAQDRHRRFASGRGSSGPVREALQLLASPRYRHLFSGLLCTVDCANKPLETFEALAAFSPPRVDFLLPHGTWEDPPPGLIPGGGSTPYADWLIAVFDAWYWESPPRPGIRMFEEITHMILGGTSGIETMGLAPARLVVVETDGAIEQGDALKAVHHGAPGTGLHVTSDSLDAALMLPGIIARQLGEHALAPRCRECKIRQVCGGGLYAHRYRSGTGFANPSVYCANLMKLITHIHETMAAEIEQRLHGGRQDDHESVRA
jgi:uncharacterized protein